tara:strand:+ start:1629 stop:2156 length:528 start_codon:yes stop_codon:yes gene_type:complete
MAKKLNVPHAKDMHAGLPQHADEDSGVKDTLQRTDRAHFVDRCGVTERHRRGHDQPRTRHQLTLAAATALQRQGRQDVGADDALQHHGLLLLQRVQQRAPALTNQIDGALDRRLPRRKGGGDGSVTRSNHCRVSTLFKSNSGAKQWCQTVVPNSVGVVVRRCIFKKREKMRCMSV